MGLQWTHLWFMAWSDSLEQHIMTQPQHKIFLWINGLGGGVAQGFLNPCMTCTIPTLHLPNTLGAWISTIILFRSHLNHGELALISLISELCQLRGRLTWVHQHTQKPVNFVCIVYLAMALPMLELPVSHPKDSTRLGTNQAVVPCRSDHRHPRILSCLGHGLT